MSLYEIDACRCAVMEPVILRNGFPESVLNKGLRLFYMIFVISKIQQLLSNGFIYENLKQKQSNVKVILL